MRFPLLSILIISSVSLSAQRLNGVYQDVYQKQLAKLNAEYEQHFLDSMSKERKYSQLVSQVIELKEQLNRKTEILLEIPEMIYAKPVSNVKSSYWKRISTKDEVLIYPKKSNFNSYFVKFKGEERWLKAEYFNKQINNQIKYAVECKDSIERLKSDIKTFTHEANSIVFMDFYYEYKKNKILEYVLAKQSAE
jgi:hypothetical protein